MSLAAENNRCCFMSVRDSTVDFAKGMLMWCVVYGHSVDALCGGMPHSPVWLHSFVRTFDLPFFMVISGYFLKRSFERKSLRSVVLDRLTMLLAPIVVWTLLRGQFNVFSGMYYFLWAVLASSMICVAARCIVSFCNSRISKAVELSLLVVAILSLYMVKIPWNMFYLFPFFVVGYYLNNLRFELSGKWIFLTFLVFSIGLCFWSPAYTPWHMGALAWKTNSWACLVYAYRTILALAGIIVMSHVFRIIMSHLEEAPFVRHTLIGGGAETLAIYILQAIVVERLVRRTCKIVFDQFDISLSSAYVNLVGYIMAPIISFFVLWLLLAIILKIKMMPIGKYLFGFKLQRFSKGA